LQDDREDDADDEEYIVRQILGIACLADLVSAEPTLAMSAIFFP
jgi:hypothetical protein